MMITSIRPSGRSGLKQQDLGTNEGNANGLIRSSYTRTPIARVLGSEPTKEPLVLARDDNPGQSSFSTTRFGTSQPTRTSTHRPTTSSRNSAFPTRPPSNTSNFHFPILAAIIIPVIIVLAIASIIYRRWRRSASAKTTVVVPPAPAPQHPAWSGSYTSPPRTDGMGRLSQPGDSGRMWATPPVSSPNSTHQWGNTGFNSHNSQVGTVGGFPGATQPLGSHNPHHSYNVPSRDSNPAWDTAYGVGSTGTAEQSRVVQMPNQSNNRQDQSGGGGHSAPAIQGRVPDTPNWGPDQQSVGLSDYQPPVTPPASKPTAQPRTRHSKGEVILEWVPAGEPSADAAQQQAGSSSGSQPPDNSELHTLRERLQRLEAALVERPDQSHVADDTPDRPPPAYDSRPSSPVRGPGQGGGSLSRMS